MIILCGNIILDGVESSLPLSHPRIGYENLLFGNVNITASSEQDNSPAINLASPLTYNFWQPVSLPANVEFEFSSAKEINYCGIAAHNLTDSGCSINVQYYNGTTWVSVGEVFPAGNRVLMFLFDTVFSNRWRIVVNGVSAPAVGVVYLGKVLEVERRIYQGHTPIKLSQNTIIRPNRSEGGQFLGRSVTRQGVSTSIALKNLSSAWVRSYFQRFMDSAVDYPFFWAWRPDKFPNEVAYVWCNDDIVPTNSGPRDKMSVSFEVSGIIK